MEEEQACRGEDCHCRYPRLWMWNFEAGRPPGSRQCSGPSCSPCKSGGPLSKARIERILMSPVSLVFHDSNVRLISKIIFGTKLPFYYIRYPCFNERASPTPFSFQATIIQQNEYLNKKFNSRFVHFLWEQHLVWETA